LKLTLSVFDGLSKGEETVREEDYEKAKRSRIGKFATVISVLAVATALFHIYALGVRATSVILLRNLHLLAGFVLIPLLYPGSRKHLNKVHFIDYVLIAAGLSISIYVMLQDEDFFLRAGVAPTTGDLFFGSLAMILILIITKRVIGLPLVIVTLFFLLYAKFAIYFPGMFMGKSHSLSKIISYVFNIDGIYGIPIGVSSTYVLLFIVFGVFLKNSGAGEFYTDFAYSIAGRTRGGPAKVAVISSALFGTISGSGIANVVTTGSITIPLMKKTGFKAYYAGAVEAVASTGGQIMPPVMGAGAFLMAEIIGVPYTGIMIAAALPALLYFISIYYVIDLQAAKRGLIGLKPDQLPALKNVLKREGHLVIPLIILIYTLLTGATPIKAAFLSILSTIVVAMFKKSTRMGIRKISKSLEDGVLGCMEVIAACACAGIIMALVSLTGIGLKLSALIVQISGAHLFIALVLTAVIVIILSMGLPTTACYIVSATIMAPALTKMGISPLQSHLFIFYYACLSGITPPVALVAYPAGAIAKANPVTVSITAFRLGVVGFLVPFMFIYSPNLLLIGSAGEVLIAGVTSLVGAYLISISSEGWFRGPVNPVSRVLLFAGGILMLIPGIKTDSVGAGLAIIAAVIAKFLGRKNEQRIGEKKITAN